MSNSNLRILGRALRMLPDLVRSGPSRRFTAADLLERAARRRPDAPFVRFEGRDVSYGELNARANRIAHWALARGLGRGDVVALLMENRPEYIAVWMGLAKAGVTTALLNTNLRGEALAHSVRTAGAVARGARRRVRRRVAVARRGRAGGRSVRGRRSRAAARPRCRRTRSARRGVRRVQPPRSAAQRARGAARRRSALLHLHVGHDGPAEGRALQPQPLRRGRRATRCSRASSQRDVLYCALPLYHTVGRRRCA